RCAPTTLPGTGRERRRAAFPSHHLAGAGESVKGPAMRFVSSRPFLFLAASALALSLAAPSLAQEAEPNGDPVPHIIIADEPETPEEPKVTPIPAEWAPIPLDGRKNSAYGLYL